MKKLIAGLLAAVLLTTAVSAEKLGAVQRIFQGQYPDYNLNTPSEYTFKLDGNDKEFILLDDENGFFVMTKDTYGTKAFDPNGTQKFDPEDENNIAYWLNHDFLTNGASSTLKLPDEIIKYIAPDSEWDTEAGFESGNCPEGYTVKCGVSLLSQTEWVKYYKRFGVRDAINGNGWWLRTPRAIGGGKDIVMITSLESLYIGGTFGKGASDTSYFVRPVFYLTEDFFKNVRLDFDTVGNEVFKAMARHFTREDLKNVYSDREIRNIGIDAEYEIPVLNLGVSTGENLLHGGYGALLSDGSSETAIIAGDTEQYVYGVFPKNPKFAYETEIEMSCKNLPNKAVTLKQYSVLTDGTVVGEKNLLITGGDKKKTTYNINIMDVPEESDFVILLLKLDKGKGGTLSFDGWSIKKIEATAEIIHNWAPVYHLNPNDEFTLNVNSNATAPQTYTASYRLEYRGRDYVSDTVEVKLSAAKAKKTFTVPLTGMVKGSAKLIIEITLGGSLLATFENDVVVMDEYDMNGYNGIARHGMNVGPGTLDYADKGGAWLDKVQRAGFNATRYGVTWSRLEGTKGSYKFDTADTIMNSVKVRKMGGLLTMNYNAPSAMGVSSDKIGPATPENVDGYVKYILKMLERYPEIEKIEIWNEPNNTGFWAPDGNVYAYANLVKAVSAAVRNYKPEVDIYCGAIDISKDGVNWTRRMFDLGVMPYVDGFSTHPYYHTAKNDVRYVGRVKEYTDIVEDYGGWKSIELSEIGWTTYDNYDLEPTMASEYVKILVHADYWDTMCDIFNFDDSGEAFGLLNKKGEAKPTYASMVNYNIQLADATPITKLDINDKCYTYLYKKNGQPIVVSWCHEVGEVSEITIPGQNVKAYDMYGNLVSEGNKVTLGEEPYYIIGADRSIFADGLSARIISDYESFAERYGENLTDGFKAKIEEMKAKAQGLASFDENGIKEFIDLHYANGIELMKERGDEAFTDYSTNMYHIYHKIGLEIADCLMTVSNTQRSDSIDRVAKLNSAYFADKTEATDEKSLTRELIRHAKRYVKYIKTAAENSNVERTNIAAWNIIANKLCDWAEYVNSVEEEKNYGVHFVTEPAELDCFSGIPQDVAVTVYNDTAAERTGTLEILDSDGQVVATAQNIVVPSGERITQNITYSVNVDESQTMTWNTVRYSGDGFEYTLPLALNIKNRGDVSLEPSDSLFGELSSVTFKVTNTTGEELSGNIKVTPPEGWTLAETKKSFNIEAKGEELVTFTVASKKQTAFNYYDFYAEVTDDDGHTIKNRELLLDFNVIVKNNNPIDPTEFNGDITDWSDAYPTYLNPPADVDSKQAWLSSQYTARIFSKWDEESFYLMADVYDDYHNNQNAWDSLWAGDSIQLAIDGANTKSKGFDGDDYEYGFALDNWGNLMAGSWQVAAGKEKGEEPTSWCNVLRDETHATTRYFIKIPKADVSPMELREGYVVGMNVCLNDANLLGGRDNFAEITPGIASGGKNPIYYRSYALKGAQPENKEQWDKMSGIFNTDFSVSEIGAEVVFSDISGHWAEKKILNAYDKGYLSGMGDGTYAPEGALTVAEAMSLIKRIYSLDDAAYDGSIAGVGADNWFAPAAAALAKAGMLPQEIFTDGVLYASRSITREEFAALLTAGKEFADAAELSYADAADVSEWAVGAVGAAYRLGYMKGDDKNMFNPQKTLTRAEAAAVVTAAAK